MSDACMRCGTDQAGKPVVKPVPVGQPRSPDNAYAVKLWCGGRPGHWRNGVLCAECLRRTYGSLIYWAREVS